MNFFDLLPYLGAGSSATIPILFWRITYLESLVKAYKKELVKERKRANLVYFYLSKKDTNFANFLHKHNSNFD